MYSRVRSVFLAELPFLLLMGAQKLRESSMKTRKEKKGFLVCSFGVFAICSVVVVATLHRRLLYRNALRESRLVRGVPSRCTYDRIVVNSRPLLLV